MPTPDSNPTVHEPAINGRIRFPRPSARQWALHLALFLITAFSTTITGILWTAELESAGGSGPAAGGEQGSLLLLPWYYVMGVGQIAFHAITHPSILATGLQFSLSLLAILTAHEAGHYLFCRYYGVDATLPFFIPQPPGLLPGTFGAFIRMKSVVPSRRALFDIGLAGPLAGFVVMVPIAIVGVLTLQHQTALPGESGVTFNDPLLFQLIGFVFKINLADGVVNPFYMAAWFGALVTALNLMPVGQLDGGHGTFSVFGRRAHWWIGRVAFVSVGVVSVLGWFWHGSPSGVVYVVLLAVLLRISHPQPQQMEPLGFTRIIIAIVTLIVFVLCFLPFPITIT
jgi:membrane-associated protease RseP (regulator of RpoE activity)